MNAAISASVVLASRLATDVSVFALILFAVLSFVLYPILKPRLQVRVYDTLYIPLSLLLITRLQIQALSTSLWILITASLCSVCVYLLTPLSTTVTALCAFVLFSITFVAPILLVWAQQYKK